MEYKLIPGMQDSVIWIDGSNSGVISSSDKGWSDYLDYLDKGNNAHIADVALPHKELILLSRTALIAAADAALGELIAQYPSAEVLTWPIQVTEAEALMRNPEIATPMLSEIAKGTMSDAIDIANIVLEKSEAYSVASGEIIAWRRQIECWIDVASSCTLQSATFLFPHLPWES